jgi:ATP-dependent Clp protease ATP-binding subunit ClpC
LQVLEEGRLTDGQGRVIDFKNTVIIMTTNLGTKDITGGPVGFTIQGDSDQTYKAMRSKVIEELKKHFKPEFLNRVDETIVFPQLSQDELLQIVDLFVRRLRERMLDRDMTLDVTDAARRQLLTIGWDPMLGARPLRRAIQHEVEDMLSEKILNGELSIGQHVLIDFAGDEFTAVMTGSILPVEEPVKGRAAKSAKVPADSDGDVVAPDAGADAPTE